MDKKLEEAKRLNQQSRMSNASSTNFSNMASSGTTAGFSSGTEQAKQLNAKSRSASSAASLSNTASSGMTTGLSSGTEQAKQLNAQSRSALSAGMSSAASYGPASGAAGAAGLSSSVSDYDLKEAKKLNEKSRSNKGLQ